LIHFEESANQIRIEDLLPETRKTFHRGRIYYLRGRRSYDLSKGTTSFKKWRKAKAITKRRVRIAVQKKGPLKKTRGQKTHDKGDYEWESNRLHATSVSLRRTQLKKRSSRRGERGPV